MGSVVGGLVVGAVVYLVFGAGVGLVVLGQLQWGWPGGPGPAVRRKWAALAQHGRGRLRWVAIAALALLWLPMLTAAEVSAWPRSSSEPRLWSRMSGEDLGWVAAGGDGGVVRSGRDGAERAMRAQAARLAAGQEIGTVAWPAGVTERPAEGVAEDGGTG